MTDKERLEIVLEFIKDLSRFGVRINKLKDSVDECTCCYLVALKARKVLEKIK